jgi:hypothetical protein
LESPAERGVPSRHDRVHDLWCDPVVKEWVGEAEIGEGHVMVVPRRSRDRHQLMPRGGDLLQAPDIVPRSGGDPGSERLDDGRPAEQECRTDDVMHGAVVGPRAIHVQGRESARKDLPRFGGALPPAQAPNDVPAPGQDPVRPGHGATGEGHHVRVGEPTPVEGAEPEPDGSRIARELPRQRPIPLRMVAAGAEHARELSQDDGPCSRRRDLRHLPPEDRDWG